MHHKLKSPQAGPWTELSSYNDLKVFRLITYQVRQGQGEKGQTARYITFIKCLMIIWVRWLFHWNKEIGFNGECLITLWFSRSLWTKVLLEGSYNTSRSSQPQSSTKLIETEELMVTTLLLGRDHMEIFIYKRGCRPGSNGATSHSPGTLRRRGWTPSS